MLFSQIFSKIFYLKLVFSFRKLFTELKKIGFPVKVLPIPGIFLYTKYVKMGHF